MAIRLLAVDLDGTLVNSRWEISPASRQALGAASARGVHIVIVTGRRFSSARPLLEQIPCAVTLIASNGAWIGSFSGEVFHRDFLPSHVARQVLATTRGYRPYAVVICDLPGNGQVLMEENASPEGPLGWYLKNNPEWLRQVPDLESALDGDPIQVMFGGPPATIEPAESLLRGSSIAEDVSLTWTKYPGRNIALLDVMNHGCSKGRALKLWAERCAVHPSEILAIGDNYNDLEMLEFAGQPVLMANSSPGFGRKEWPVTLSNDQDGVAAAIEAYILRRSRESENKGKIADDSDF